MERNRKFVRINIYTCAEFLTEFDIYASMFLKIYNTFLQTSL